MTAPDLAGPVTSFLGENYNNSQLYYSWQPPVNGVEEYELRRWQDGVWEFEATLPGTQTYYLHNYPASDRNESILMSIRHRASGPWSEPIFDETKGSFRNPGSDLFFYGMHLTDADAYEQNGGESPVLGNPEFRIIVTQGTSPTSGQIIQEVVRPTTRCVVREEIVIPVSIDVTIPIEYSHYYVPIDGAVPIIQNWNSDLHGQYLKVKMSETDMMEVTADMQVLTEENSRSFIAKIGTKIFGNLNLQLGYKLSTRERETTKIFFPATDAPFEDVTYTYNEPMEQESNNMFFGPEYHQDLCCYFWERGAGVLCGD